MFATFFSTSFDPSIHFSEWLSDSITRSYLLHFTEVQWPELAKYTVLLGLTYFELRGIDVDAIRSIATLQQLVCSQELSTFFFYQISRDEDREKRFSVAFELSTSLKPSLPCSRPNTRRLRCRKLGIRVDRKVRRQRKHQTNLKKLNNKTNDMVHFTDYGLPSETIYMILRRFLLYFSETSWPQVLKLCAISGLQYLDFLGYQLHMLDLIDIKKLVVEHQQNFIKSIKLCHEEVLLDESNRTLSKSPFKFENNLQTKREIKLLTTQKEFPLQWITGAWIPKWKRINIDDKKSQQNQIKENFLPIYPLWYGEDEPQDLNNHLRKPNESKTKRTQKSISTKNFTSLKKGVNYKGVSSSNSNEINVLPAQKKIQKSNYISNTESNLWSNYQGPIAFKGDIQKNKSKTMSKNTSLFRHAVKILPFQQQKQQPIINETKIRNTDKSEIKKKNLKKAEGSIPSLKRPSSSTTKSHPQISRTVVQNSGVVYSRAKDVVSTVRTSTDNSVEVKSAATSVETKCKEPNPVETVTIKRTIQSHLKEPKTWEKKRVCEKKRRTHTPGIAATEGSGSVVEEKRKGRNHEATRAQDTKSGNHTESFDDASKSDKADEVCNFKTDNHVKSELLSSSYGLRIAPVQHNLHTDQPKSGQRYTKTPRFGAQFSPEHSSNFVRLEWKQKRPESQRGGAKEDSCDMRMVSNECSDLIGNSNSPAPQGALTLYNCQLGTLFWNAVNHPVIHQSIAPTPTSLKENKTEQFKELGPDSLVESSEEGLESSGGQERQGSGRSSIELDEFEDLVEYWKKRKHEIESIGFEVGERKKVEEKTPSDGGSLTNRSSNESELSPLETARSKIPHEEQQWIKSLRMTPPKINKKNIGLIPSFPSINNVTQSDYGLHKFGTSTSENPLFIESDTLSKSKQRHYISRTAPYIGGYEIRSKPEDKSKYRQEPTVEAEEVVDLIRWTRGALRQVHYRRKSHSPRPNRRAIYRRATRSTPQSSATQTTSRTTHQEKSGQGLQTLFTRWDTFNQKSSSTTVLPTDHALSLNLALPTPIIKRRERADRLTYNTYKTPSQEETAIYM